MFMFRRCFGNGNSCSRHIAGIRTRGIRGKRVDDISRANEIKETMQRSIQGFNIGNVKLFDPKHRKVPDEIYGDKSGPHYKEKVLFPMEEDVPTEYDAAIQDLDYQYDVIKKQAAIALQDPDVILYESLMNYRIKELEMKWMMNGESISRSSLDELDKKRNEIIMEVNEQFDFYFSILPKLSRRERREYRQNFLDEMGGILHFYEDEKWKTQFLLPEYDLTKNPISLEEQFKLFLNNGMQLENMPDKLYKHYDELMHYVPLVSGNTNNVASPESCPDRILAHLDKRNCEGKLEQLRRSYEEAEKKLAEIDDELLEKDTEDTDLLNF